MKKKIFKTTAIDQVVIDVYDAVRACFFFHSTIKKIESIVSFFFIAKFKLHEEILTEKDNQILPLASRM
jgi:hypothetical protein